MVVWFSWSAGGQSVSGSETPLDFIRAVTTELKLGHDASPQLCSLMGNHRTWVPLPYVPFPEIAKSSDNAEVNICSFLIWVIICDVGSVSKTLTICKSQYC